MEDDEKVYIDREEVGIMWRVKEAIIPAITIGVGVFIGLTLYHHLIWR